MHDDINQEGIPVHGGLSLRELRSLGLSGEAVIDFSVNSNPLGPPSRALEALRKLDISAYPDPENLELREALSVNTGVPAGQIAVGNGTTELIHLLVRTAATRERRIIILTPTFSEYETAVRRSGADAVTVTAAEQEDFHWDMMEVCRTIRKLEPELVFLCNPNNPTGVYLSRKDVESVIAAVGYGLLAFDESYTAFVDEPWKTADLLDHGSVVILHSMTKEYAMAGLRLGYALGPEPMIRALLVNQPSWSVNAAAQAAGFAALSDPAYLVRSRACVQESKSFLIRELQALGLSVVPSAANFIMVRVGNAARLRQELLIRGISVRDCTSFGLPAYIRIGVRTMRDCQQLIAAVEPIIAAGRKRLIAAHAGTECRGSDESSIRRCHSDEQ